MPSAEALKDYYVDQIKTTGYVSAANSLSGSDIDPLFHDFRGVLFDAFEEPDTQGQHIVKAFASFVPDRPGDSHGFIEQRRRGRINPYEIDRGAATEDKDVLHFTPQTREQAYAYLRDNGGIPLSVRRLVERCTEVHEAIKTSVKPVMAALGLENYLFAPKGLESRDVHVLRIIRYLGTSASSAQPFKSHDELAELHFDRSKMTAAVWESSSGLVGAPGNNALGDTNLTVAEFDDLAQRALATRIRHRSGEVKIFAGAGYNRLPKEVQEISGNLTPLLHGVLDDNPGQERDAVVLFFNEYSDIKTCSVASKQETGFENVRQAVAERQECYGSVSVI